MHPVIANRKRELEALCERFGVHRLEIFGSAAGISLAQASYRDTLSGLKCRCPKVTVSARPVTTLGDQAAEVFVAPQPDAPRAPRHPSTKRCPGPAASRLSPSRRQS